MENNNETAEQEIQENSDNENNPDKSGNEEKNGFNDVIEIIESTLITIFTIVMVFTYILHPVNVVGHSMYPTLNKYADDNTEDTDRIFMSTVFLSIDYGDIVVVNNDRNYLIDDSGNPYVPENIAPLNECIIKRVIATGGQTIDIKDSQVIIDGEVLDEPYISKGSTTYDLGAFGNQYPFKVPEGYYFVMGDNRNRSSDSRAPQVGLVKKEQIYGKAIMRYSPLKYFHILTDSWEESAND